MEKMTVRGALEIAVKTEQLGDKFYTELANRYSGNPKLQEMFEFLAKDETEHEKQFKALLENYKDDDTPLSQEDTEYLQAVDLSKFFKYMEDLGEDLTPKDVLKLAYRVEKEAVLFFSGIRDAIGGNPELEAIIKMEKQHMSKVMKYLVEDSKFRGIEDEWV